MRLRSTLASLVAIGMLAGLLAACAPTENETVAGSSATVATAGAVTSLNPLVTGQDTAANRDFAALTSAGFWTTGPDGEPVTYDRFGSVRVLSPSPLTVRYTVADGATWSDGAAVDAADLLLVWAARTTHRTGGDPDAEGRPSTRWDAGAGAGSALDLVSQVPEVGDDGRSITLVYDIPYADWRAAFDAPPVAAHALTRLAYPDEYADADAAKSAFRAAVASGDLAWLAPVARVFREGFLVRGDMAPETLLTAGAYRIDRLTPDGSEAHLVADAERRGAPVAPVEELDLRAMPDAAARIDAVVAGRADLAAADADAALVAAAEPAPHALTDGAPFDHLDLQTAGGGVFDPDAHGGDVATALALRRAFLATVPRDALAAELAGAVERHSLVGSEASAPSAAPAPDAAALLAEAGVAAPTVRVLYPAGDARRAAEFAALQAAAATAGITLVDVSREDWAQVRTAQPDAYDVALFAWRPDPESALALASGFHTASAQNVYGWSDERVDGLFSRLAATMDAAERRTLLDELDAAIAEQAWSLALVEVPQLAVTSDALREAPVVTDAQRILSGYAHWMPVRGGSAQ